MQDVSDNCLWTCVISIGVAWVLPLLGSREQAPANIVHCSFLSKFKGCLPAGCCRYKSPNTGCHLFSTTVGLRRTLPGGSKVHCTKTTVETVSGVQLSVNKGQHATPWQKSKSAFPTLLRLVAVDVASWQAEPLQARCHGPTRLCGLQRPKIAQAEYQTSTDLIVCGQSQAHLYATTSDMTRKTMPAAF